MKLVVLIHFGSVLFFEAVVDWRDEMAASRETAFAGGGWSCDEGEEVGEDLTLSVDAGDVRETG